MAFQKYFARLVSRGSSAGDMSQLVHGERSLFRSLSGEIQPIRAHDKQFQPMRDQYLTIFISGMPEMEEDSSRTLGTIKGVFAPVSLSMFSALLFLRVGYIVGNAGFLETVLLFSIAYIILVSTVFR